MRKTLIPGCLTLWLNLVLAADTDSVYLDAKALQLAGIKTETLTPVRQYAEYTAYGAVLSPEPLLQLRQQYLTAQTQRNTAQAKYTESDLNLARTESLHEHKVVSTHRLQEQRAQWQTDQANLQAGHDRINSILAGSRLEWGELLTNWFVIMADNSAQPFIRHSAQLVQINLPASARLDAKVRTIHIDENGQRDSAITAELISVSPRIDLVTQGQSYFFKSSARPIPFGAHITAWIARDAKQISGFNIPRSAVVWHMGQAYVYVKKADGEFNRRALPAYSLNDSNYFVTEAFTADEALVTTGAQTLLSQQLKKQIPDEDDD
ncbi:MAG: hypothetical protein ABSB19_04570 [Methylomonas sp.]|jgi:hypothetical protein